MEIIAVRKNPPLIYEGREIAVGRPVFLPLTTAKLWIAEGWAKPSGETDPVAPRKPAK